MNAKLATVTLLVRDHDAAIAFFTGALRFALLADEPLGLGRRWVLVGPPEGARLLLALASSAQDLALVGRQAGERVFLLLHSSDFDADHAHMESRGVHFLEAPRDEAYGRVAMFEDLYGNKWDLIQPR